MSEEGTKSFSLSSMPPLGQAKKPSVPVKGKATSVTISPVPMRKIIKTTYGGQPLVPAPGRLTPTGQGRIKAPPVCKDAALKRVSSSNDEFHTAGVCFSPEEADSCAQQAFELDAKLGYNSMDDMPLNIEECDAGPLLKRKESVGSALSSEGMGSSCTVVTTSSAGSCGRGATPATAQGPPLEVVRTLSTAFTDNLVKENSSRQGRSLQRWLVHSPTEQLVRQVAGTVPITRDGRIILASASRKTEWILPKGGWDADETKEECAARETFEEAGLLGRLGGCLEPIDYERSKAKKRRLSKVANGGADGKDGGDGGGGGSSMVKRRKTEELMTPPSAGFVSVSSSVKNTELPEPTGSTGASSDKGKAALSKTSVQTTSFNPKNYSYVRLFLCPLYVTEVKSDWPEKGRLRKMVDIDEAIRIMEVENRLYFKRGLEMVKERGLHLLKP